MVEVQLLVNPLVTPHDSRQLAALSKDLFDQQVVRLQAAGVAVIRRAPGSAPASLGKCSSHADSFLGMHAGYSTAAAFPRGQEMRWDTPEQLRNRFLGPRQVILTPLPCTMGIARSRGGGGRGGQGGGGR